MSNQKIVTSIHRMTNTQTDAHRAMSPAPPRIPCCSNATVKHHFPSSLRAVVDWLNSIPQKRVGQSATYAALRKMGGTFRTRNGEADFTECFDQGSATVLASGEATPDPMDHLSCSVSNGSRSRAAGDEDTASHKGDYHPMWISRFLTASRVLPKISSLLNDMGVPDLGP